MNPQPSPVRGELIGTTEAAKRLGIKNRTLIDWCRSMNPKVAFYFDGETYRFDTEDIDDFLRAIKVPAGPRLQRIPAGARI
jgi:excisionase family DNA binding protein